MFQGKKISNQIIISLVFSAENDLYQNFTPPICFITHILKLYNFMLMSQVFCTSKKSLTMNCLDIKLELNLYFDLLSRKKHFIEVFLTNPQNFKKATDASLI